MKRNDAHLLRNLVVLVVLLGSPMLCDGGLLSSRSREGYTGWDRVLTGEYGRRTRWSHACVEVLDEGEHGARISSQPRRAETRRARSSSPPLDPCSRTMDCK